MRIWIYIQGKKTKWRNTAAALALLSILGSLTALLELNACNVNISPGISAMQCIKEDEDVCLIWFDRANNYHEKDTGKNSRTVGETRSKQSMKIFGNGTDPGPRVNRRPNWHRTDPIPCEQNSTKWKGTVPPLDQNSSDPV